MKTVSFGEWLIGELKKRDWTQAKLAREANVSAPAISDVISGRRKAGKDLATAIARAFDIPPDQVFRAAGILPEEPDVDELTDEILHKAKKLDSEDRQTLLEFINMLDRLRSRKDKSK